VSHHAGMVCNPRNPSTPKYPLLASESANVRSEADPTNAPILYMPTHMGNTRLASPKMAKSENVKKVHATTIVLMWYGISFSNTRGIVEGGARASPVTPNRTPIGSPKTNLENSGVFTILL
jgi:hypothetical protein